jgi:uncharacterized membrane-anchored protein YitT (DUF2179 family)
VCRMVSPRDNLRAGFMRRVWVRQILAFVIIAIGTGLLAVTFNAFLSANHVMVAGIGGVAMLLAILFHVPLGLVYLILNIPLFLGGWRYVGFWFFLKSIWGTVTLSFFLVMTKSVPDFHNTLLAALLGGAISGVAIGVVLLAGGATGGIDIVSVVINSRSHWSVGRIMFVLNAFIILCGALLFGFSSALLTIASVFVTSVCVQAVLKLGRWDKRVDRQAERQRSLSN